MPEKSQSPERKTVVVVGLGMVGIGSYSLATRRMSNTVSDSPAFSVRREVAGSGYGRSIPDRNMRGGGTP